MYMNDTKGLIDVLGIRIVREEAGVMVMEMPVSKKVLQPYGYLHGGASVVLAESAASIGAARRIADDEITFGMEINANHLKTKQDGVITATATCRHKGRSSQIWEIELVDETGDLVCLSRCTMAVKKKR